MKRSGERHSTPRASTSKARDWRILGRAPTMRRCRAAKKQRTLRQRLFLARCVQPAVSKMSKRKPCTPGGRCDVRKIGSRWRASAHPTRSAARVGNFAVALLTKSGTHSGRSSCSWHVLHDKMILSKLIEHGSSSRKGNNMSKSEGGAFTHQKNGAVSGNGCPLLEQEHDLVASPHHPLQRRVRDTSKDRSDCCALHHYL